MRKEQNNQSRSDIEFFKNRAKRKAKSGKTTSGKSNNFLKIALSALVTIVIILLVIVLAVFGIYTYFRRIYKPDASNSNKTNAGLIVENIHPETGEQFQLLNDKYTFLALGCDKSGNLTDVIMVISYDMKNQKATILSIPRDTYVKVNSKLIIDENGNISKDNFINSSAYGTKINEVFSRGKTLASTELSSLVSNASGKTDAEIEKLCEKSVLGIDMSTLSEYMNETNSKNKNTLKNAICENFGYRYLSVLIYYNFGVPCDYYARVNISGFRNIVDAIDGVDVYVPERMYYKDPLQDLYIDIPAGNQHLNGKKAEEFVRFRSGYYSADIGRINAQKIFMTAFIKKLCSPQIVTKIGEIIEIIQNNLTTNISVSDAMYFATHAIEMDLSNIVMITLPGTSQYIGNVSYYLGDKAEIMNTVNTYLNKYNKDLNEAFFCIESASSSHSNASNAVSADNVSSETVVLDFIHANNNSNATSNSAQTNTDNTPSQTQQDDSDESDTNQSSGELSQNDDEATPKNPDIPDNNSDTQTDDANVQQDESSSYSQSDFHNNTDVTESHETDNFSTDDSNNTAIE